MIEYPETARRQSREYLSRSCISKDFKKKTSVGQKNKTSNKYNHTKLKSFWPKWELPISAEAAHKMEESLFQL